MTKLLEVWPASIVPDGQYYRTPDGKFPRVTAILNVLGTKTEGLIKWAANEERKAAIEAASDAWVEDHFTDGVKPNIGRFQRLIETKLGPARQHQKQIAKAADIGTAAHAMVADHLSNTLLSSTDLQAKKLKEIGVIERPNESVMAYRAWLDWWTGSGLKVVRVEQSVWDKDLGYAGTIDAVVECPKRGLGVIDLKTSKGIYDSHHLQVAAYVHAAKRWGDIRWAEIVRLPKTIDDPAFEVVPVGKLYDRTLDQVDMMHCFGSCLLLWNHLCSKSGKATP